MAVSIAVTEGGARLLMPHWSEFDAEHFIHQVDVPGFGPVQTGIAGFDGWFAQNNGDFRVHIHVDALGLRNDEPVSAAAGALWALGDSFTFGWGVERAQTFGAVASTAMYSIASPGTDVCGYHILLARMPSEVKPAALVLGLTMENDVAVYDCAERAIPTPAAGAKGRFGIDLMRVKTWLTGHSALYNLAAVAVKRNPVALQWLIAVGAIKKEHLAVHRVGNYPPAALESTADTVAALRSRLPPDAPMAVLVIPERGDVTGENAVAIEDRVALVDLLRQRGLTVIDPSRELRAAGMPRMHFAHDGHWSPAGHQLAGEQVAAWLAAVLKK